MKEKILSISFVVLLFFFLLLGLIIKDKDISLLERRNLTTKEDLKNNPFDNLESYLSDQFPGRNLFLSLNSFINRSVLKNKEENNIYIKEDVLIEKNYPLNEKSVEEFSRKINTVASKFFKDNCVFYAIIPDKSYFLENKGYQKLDFEKMLNTLKKDITIPYIDIISLFQLEDYYKTDIHLKQESYHKVINKLGNSFNFSLQDIPWNKENYNEFYGATYAKGMPLAHEENLSYYTNKWTDEAIVWHLEYGNRKVYDKDKLGSVDSYSLFLSGPSSIIEMSSPNAINDRELILFRDSFGSSLAPLLLPYYKKITLIDLRYINMNMVEQYVTFENQDILFLYSTLLVNSSNLLKI